jgi:FKBP-type peptidyl-prolyl cis-trans isomerase SlyD
MGNIIAGLEKGLEGMEPGESKEIVVQPEDGYGIKDPGLIQQVPRQRFPGGFAFKAGMSYLARSDSGAMVNFQVLGFDDESVEIDMNHPLAGRALYFQVRIKDVREEGEQP